MVMRVISGVKRAILIVGLTMFTFAGELYAAGATATGAPSGVKPDIQDDDSRLNLRLKAAKKDLEVLPNFADYFEASGDANALEQMKEPLEGFLKNHVDSLLAQCGDGSSDDTKLLAAEIMFLKAHLLMNVKRDGEARYTLTEMKRRFSSLQNVIVELSGMTATLYELTQHLEDELAKAPSAAKK
jgi:hypothetical protein